MQKNTNTKHEGGLPWPGQGELLWTEENRPCLDGDRGFCLSFLVRLFATEYALGFAHCNAVRSNCRKRTNGTQGTGSPNKGPLPAVRSFECICRPRVVSCVTPDVFFFTQYSVLRIDRLTARAFACAACAASTDLRQGIQDDDDEIQKKRTSAGQTAT